MAKQSPKTYQPVTMESRTTTRAIKLPSWNNFRLAHWKQTNQKFKKEQNVIGHSKRPLGSLYIFPSNDPYFQNQRMEFRAVHENVSWINRAIKIMVSCVTGFGYTTSIEPRDIDEQLQDEELDKWKNEQRFSIPWANDIIENPDDGKEGWSAAEIEKFVHNLSIKLDYQAHQARCYRYTLEQGQCGIMMLPEMKVDPEKPDQLVEEGDNAKWVMPELLRTIRPEHTVKIWIDMNTGEMSSLQVIGLASRGGKLPVERLIWFMSDYNLELNSDYYGESRILPLLDTGKVMIILYGKDFPEAAQYTWHQPKVFQVQIPPRDYKKVKTVLREFLNKANNSAGRDIAVTQSVDLIGGANATNSGDIRGLIELDDHLIDQTAGFFNIPPFLLSKGKAGNLGGNAQEEEIDAFLNVEVRPQQEIVESFTEKQLYDRILMILFQVDDPEELPVRLRHNLVKPDIRTLFDKEQYEIMLDMVQRELLSEDKMIKRLNLEDVKREITISRGSDPTPGQNTWPNKFSRKYNPHWDSRGSGWKDTGKPPIWNDRPQVKVTNKEVKTRARQAIPRWEA